MNKNLLIFIIIALVILGAVYYFSMTPPIETGQETVTGETSTQALEQELTQTNLDNLDQEFVDIETELEATVSEAQ